MSSDERLRWKRVLPLPLCVNSPLCIKNQKAKVEEKILKQHIPDDKFPHPTSPEMNIVITTSAIIVIIVVINFD